MAERTKAKKLPAMAKAAAVKKATELLRLIARRKGRIVEDFYDIGAALKELLDKKLYLALGHASFEAMLEKRDVIGRTQAFKLIAVARELPRERALDVGAERAYALVALAAATPEKDSAGSILNTGVAVRGKVKDVTGLSKRELEAVTKTVRPIKKVTDDERNARADVRHAQAALRASGVAAAVTLERAKGKWFAIVRVPLEKLSHLVRER
ncbi:hypothetical protein BH09MYX1_BH09MYX1_36810 [soil metagenome]